MAESVGDNRAFLHDATSGISVSQKKWIGGYDCVPNQSCGTLLIDAIVVLNKQTRGSFLTTKNLFIDENCSFWNIPRCIPVFKYGQSDGPSLERFHITVVISGVKNNETGLRWRPKQS